MSLNKMYQEFNSAYAITELEKAGHVLFKRTQLSLEEVQEALDEVAESYTITLSRNNGTSELLVQDLVMKQDINFPAWVKECCDIGYITYQGLRAMGIDLDACMDEVHRSNMSKALPITVDNHVVEEQKLKLQERYDSVIIVETETALLFKNESNGKLLKTAYYSPANLEPLVQKPYKL